MRRSSPITIHRRRKTQAQLKIRARPLQWALSRPASFHKRWLSPRQRLPSLVVRTVASQAFSKLRWSASRHFWWANASSSAIKQIPTWSLCHQRELMCLSIIILTRRHQCSKSIHSRNQEIQLRTIWLISKRTNRIWSLRLTLSTGHVSTIRALDVYKLALIGGLICSKILKDKSSKNFSATFSDLPSHISTAVNMTNQISLIC